MGDRTVAGPAVRLGGRTAGPPVRTGWDATSEPASVPDELGDLVDVDDAGATVGVLTRAASGTPARFAPLPEPPPPPAPPPVPQRYTQVGAADRWQIEHNLGYRPHFVIHDSDGRLVLPDNIEHPVPGSISEVVFGTPFAGVADPA